MSRIISSFLSSYKQYYVLKDSATSIGLSVEEHKNQSNIKFSRTFQVLFARVKKYLATSKIGRLTATDQQATFYNT